MGLDLFRIAKGLELESEDFLSSVNILFGTGAPGGGTLHKIMPVLVRYI